MPLFVDDRRVMDPPVLGAATDDGAPPPLVSFPDGKERALQGREEREAWIRPN